MLKGHVFSKQLFENQIFALFINTFLNGINGVSNNYKNGMQVTYSGSTLTINSGAVCIQGRFLEEDTSTPIATGTNNAYCKLVIEIDLDKQNTESQLNQAAYKVITSASSYPELTQTNIVKNVAGIYQYELARFRTSASGITDFQDMRTFLDFDSIFEEIRQEYGQVLQELKDELASVVDGSDYLLKSAGGTVEGEIVAKGGVRGNLAGNAATATRLQTARTITLSGDVTGSASFNGSANVTITTNIANVVVLTGKLSSGKATINYPAGYSKDNCVILSFSLDNTNLETRHWSYGNLFDATSWMGGSIPYKIYMSPSNITVETKRVILINESYPSVGDSTVTYNYKLVLMKI